MRRSAPQDFPKHLSRYAPREERNEMCNGCPNRAGGFEDAMAHRICRVALKSSAALDDKKPTYPC